MGRFIGLAIKRDYSGSIYSNGGGGSGTIVKTSAYDRSSGITTDSNNNVTAITLGDNSYRYIYYNAVGLITGFTEDIGNDSKGWKLEYNSHNLVTNITEQNPTMDPGYSINSNGSVDEGSNITINFETVGVILGDTYYWTIETNTGDFATTSGSFTHSSNPIGFVVQPTEDFTAEGAEIFTVAVRSGSTSGTILATSSNITINDTSDAPPQGQQLFTITGENNWIVPAGVSAISGACISGGTSGEAGDLNGTDGQGGAGGSGAFENSISVTPGETLIIHVGVGGSMRYDYNSSPKGNDGGPSGIRRGSTWLLKSGMTTWYGNTGGTSVRSPGAEVGIGSGTGGGDMTLSSGAQGTGNEVYNLDGNGYFSAGAGGYYGGAGGGGNAFGPNPAWMPTVGQAGGYDTSPNYPAPRYRGDSMNGVGTYDIYQGQYTEVIGGIGTNGGTSGADNSDPWPSASNINGADGGLYGGAGGGGRYGGAGGAGGQGAVKVIWGSGRQWPSTNTQNVANGITGQQEYTTPGSYTWTCPAGVTSVCVVAVGAGGDGNGSNGGGGGGLGWRNNISVTPGQSYTLQVGGYSSNSSGTNSYFIDVNTVMGGGGTNFQSGGGYTGDGGGAGGNGGNQSAGGGGGGGAGGYAGDGGDGGNGVASPNFSQGGNGTGGGGGGASGCNHEGGAGGGVGLQGQGSGGTGANDADQHSAGIDYYYGHCGKGGSGGYPISHGPSASFPPTNEYGTSTGIGGGGGGGNGVGGGHGGVRIIWGNNRAFPFTNTEDI